jgi:mevalonate kinase
MKRKWGFILRDRIGSLTLMNKQVLKMNQKMKLLVTISSNQELLTRLTVTESYVSTVTRRYVSTVTGRYIST